MLCNLSRFEVHLRATFSLSANPSTRSLLTRHLARLFPVGAVGTPGFPLIFASHAIGSLVSSIVRHRLHSALGAPFRTRNFDAICFPCLLLGPWAWSFRRQLYLDLGPKFLSCF